MPIILYRIDERLLHGQVLVGWGGRLEIDFYVVVDDPLSVSAWEQELYEAALPDGTEAHFLSVKEGLDGLPALDARADSGALLTRGTEAMRALAEAGLLAAHRVDLGGLHSGPERRKALDYVYLSEREREDLIAIERRAGEVVARDLPTSAPVPLERLIDALDRS